jgi:lipopolysaccharide export LptBFGC system permease protein LptF
MFRFDEDLNLRFHLSAERLRYAKGAWIADGGWFRTINEDGSDKFTQITRPLEVGITEGPDYFGQEYRRPAEMSFAELMRYISELEESGAQPIRLVVSLHQKLTYPLSAFIMIFLALPFALNRGGHRVTTMQGIALALGLGIGYFLMTAAFGKMGEADILPPIVGVWTPVAVAGLFAINRLTTLRS